LCLSLAQAQTSVDVQSGTVVAVDGNHLVVKMSDGTTKEFNVPDGATANVDGKDLSVADLKPGMVLTRTITTTTEPVKVTTTTVKSGTVWKVMPPTLIVTTADGKNKQFTVPDWQKFDVDGKMLSVNELKKGMKLTATIVSESTSTVTSTSRKVTGMAPKT